MSNHPNRRPSAASNPAPDAIKAARATAGLTQTVAAALVHTTLRNWQHWEAGDRRMHPAIWELWQIKADALMPEPTQEQKNQQSREWVAAVMMAPQRNQD